jgi:hypothetical protein
VQRIDLTFIREQLDDDDRAREREGDGDVERRGEVEAEGRRDREPDERRERHLAESGGDGHRPDRPNHVDIEPEPHDEQEQRNADAGQQFDLGVGRDQSDAGRADDEADEDERDNQRLAEPGPQRADERRDQQDGGKFAEGGVGQHAGVTRMICGGWSFGNRRT